MGLVPEDFATNCRELASPNGSVIGVNMNAFINLNTLNVTQLATILNKDESTIYSDLNRAPWRLPPPANIEGTRTLIWLEVVVFEWLVERSNSGLKIEKPSKGRPRKSRIIRFSNIAVGDV